MNVRDYIATGILEEYCLGLLSNDEQEMVLQVCRLYPDVRKELTAIENAMEKMAAIRAVTPNSSLRGKLLTSLGFSEPVIKFALDDLPPTRPNSNHHSWLASLAHLIPAEPAEDFLCHVLRKDEVLAQMLIIAKNNVPEETHDNYKESFFILKGRCECTVGANTFMLGPGDFLEIPINVEHDVKMLTPHVVAILQYEFV